MTPVRKRIWPPQLAASEGLATARTGRWTSLLLVTTVAWLVAAPGAADAAAVTRMLSTERSWLDAGGDVYRARAPGEVTTTTLTGNAVVSASAPGSRSISAVACEQLAQLDGVLAAFAVQQYGYGSLSRAPGRAVPLYLATPGVLRLFDVPADPAGTVLTTTDFAQHVGIRDGDHVALELHSDDAVAHGMSDGGISFVEAPSAHHATATDPLTARLVSDSTASGIAGYSWALLVPTAGMAEAESCIVQTDAAHRSAVLPQVALALADDDVPATISAVRPRDEYSVDFSTWYQERELGRVWMVCAALLGLLWALLQWFRRSQVAVYATFGLHASARLIMQVSEWGVLSGLGVLWGWSLGVVGALVLGARSEQALTQVSYHAALTVLGATVLVVLLGLRPTGTLLNTLKDR